jgi:hypothetical protein
MELLEPEAALRSQLTALIRTCRSARKARGHQQLVTNGDKLVTPFSSPLSRGFAAICHNQYYIFVTEKNGGANQDIEGLWPKA